MDTPLENTLETSILTDLPHFKGLQIAHTVTRSDRISLLIGANHYWDFVGDHTIPHSNQFKSGVRSVRTTFNGMVTNHKQEEKDLKIYGLLNQSEQRLYKAVWP